MIYPSTYQVSRTGMYFAKFVNKEKQPPETEQLGVFNQN
jgi:hypothetical protein